MARYLMADGAIVAPASGVWDLQSLDTLRRELMHAGLDEITARREVWKFDIIPTSRAGALAVCDWDFDNFMRSRAAVRAAQPWALVGPGILDHHFATPEDLRGIVTWLCGQLAPFRDATTGACDGR